MEDHKIPTALSKAIRPLPEDTQLDVLLAVHPLENRDQQLERVGEVKDLLQQGIPVEGALDLIGQREKPSRAPRSREPRPTRLTRPFEWQPEGILTFLRVNYAALAQVRLTRTRTGSYESWVEALVEDLTALRDVCADADEGGEAWARLREALQPVMADAGDPK